MRWPNVDNKLESPCDKYTTECVRLQPSSGVSRIVTCFCDKKWITS